MERSRRTLLYGAAVFLIAAALAAIELAAVAWYALASRGAGALAVVLLELAFAYLLVAGALVARARGQLAGLLTAERLHVLGTVVGATLGVPVGLSLGVGSPAAILLLSVVFALVPTALQALFGSARGAGSASKDE